MESSTGILWKGTHAQEAIARLTNQSVIWAYKSLKMYELQVKLVGHSARVSVHEWPIVEIGFELQPMHHRVH